MSQLADWGNAAKSRLWRVHFLFKNAVTRRPVTGDAQVTVSLTSYGTRLASSFIAVESIGRGNVRPSRLVLWVSHSELESPLPRKLVRLQKRGLEIIGAEDYGSHKKYFPYVLSQEQHRSPLVTADDDVVYPRNWLESLVQANGSRPRNVHGWRARTISVRDGRISPYETWPMSTSSLASVHTFLTGVGGVIYPPAVLDALRLEGDRFMELCPKADDVWLYRAAVRAGCYPSQLADRPNNFPTIPGTQEHALLSHNVHGTGNDAQIALTLEAEDVARILSESMK